MSIVQYCYALSKSIPGYSRLYQASRALVQHFVDSPSKGQVLKFLTPSKDKLAVATVTYAESPSFIDQLTPSAIPLSSSPDTYIDWKMYDSLVEQYGGYIVKTSEDRSANEIEFAKVVLTGFLVGPGMLIAHMAGILGCAVYGIMAAPIVKDACEYIKSKNFNYKNNLNDVRVVAMHLAINSEMLPRNAKFSEVLELAKILAIAILHTPKFTIEHFRESMPSSVHVKSLLELFDKYLAENTIIRYNNEYIHVDMGDAVSIREQSVLVFALTSDNSEKTLPFKILAQKKKLVEFYRTLNEPKSYADQKIDAKSFAALHYQKALDYLRLLEQQEATVPAIQVENVSTPRESIKLSGNPTLKTGFFQSKV